LTDIDAHAKHCEREKMKSGDKEDVTESLDKKEWKASEVCCKGSPKLDCVLETLEEENEGESDDKERCSPPLLVVEVRSNDNNLDSPLARETPKVESALQFKKTQISQSLLARTRSRADVDAGAAIPTSLLKVVDHRSKTESKDDETLFLTLNLARKRTKVVQLLIFGLIGIIGGFFGSIFVQFSCNFASALVTVGQYDNSFKIHLGLWKYTPIDSVFQGYSYCWPYDESYTSSAPTLARISGLFALVSGSFSLAVLWVYLVLGITNEFFWSTAVKVLILTGVCQILTFTFFIDNICSEDICFLGPGAIISSISTIVWFLLAYEMYRNAPVSAILPSLPTKSNKFNQINQRAKNAWNFFFAPKHQEQLPSHTSAKKYDRMTNKHSDESSKKSSINRQNTQERRHASNTTDELIGSYIPPDVDGVIA